MNAALDALIIFTYFIILVAGGVVGAGITGFFWLRFWLREKLENLTVEITDEGA